jgi:hypothetical protein
MQVHCVLCSRFFKGQRELDQHIRDSSVHKKQQAGSLVKPAKPQALGPLIPATKREHRQPPSAIISSSSTPQIAKPAVKTAPQGLPWSVLVQSEHVAVLNALSAHCHTPTELKENDYIIHPYNPLDYINSRKCKRCNSRFLLLILASKLK